MRVTRWAWGLLLVLAISCAEQPAAIPSAGRRASPPAPPPLAGAPVAPAPVAPTAGAAAPAGQVGSADSPPAAGQKRVAAEVGVGKKGRKLDDPKLFRPLVEPARAFFSVRERIVFEIQIPHAMNLFQASEGRWPKDFAEFEQKIIRFNQIQLPELPEGHRYVYDGKGGELMVERPQQ